MMKKMIRKMIRKMIKKIIKKIIRKIISNIGIFKYLRYFSIFIINVIFFDLIEL